MSTAAVRLDRRASFRIWTGRGAVSSSVCLESGCRRAGKHRQHCPGMACPAALPASLSHQRHQAAKLQRAVAPSQVDGAGAGEHAAHGDPLGVGLLGAWAGRGGERRMEIAIRGNALRLGRSGADIPPGRLSMPCLHAAAPLCSCSPPGLLAASAAPTLPALHQSLQRPARIVGCGALDHPCLESREATGHRNAGCSPDARAHTQMHEGSSSLRSVRRCCSAGSTGVERTLVQAPSAIS